MRNGFSLITAIIFIVLIATIGALALSLSTQSVKQTGDLYLQTQADLLAQSGTELALLAFSAHDINATNGCVNTVLAQYPDNTDPIFNIEVSIQYLGRGLPNGAGGGNCDLLSNAVATDDSNITLIMDTVVTSVAGIATEPIRIHRRTLQKP
jgi:type II secretory pathway pseudopilin PulG